ncbi:MAG: hypothetical protein RBS39_06725 [Phycisphaerales bacterium]|jgi:DNA-binding response OmpR family regulator|nr:hypothetical protein [Phycisphaerales bacterium]
MSRSRARKAGTHGAGDAGGNAPRSRGTKGGPARREALEFQVPARVLVVSEDAGRLERMLDHLCGRVARCVGASSMLEAMQSVEMERFDVAILDAALPEDGAYDLAGVLFDTNPGIASMLWGESDMEHAVRAMRLGAVDVVPADADAGEAHRRVASAYARARRVQGREERIARLKRVCERLNAVREEVSTQVGSLCTDLVSAYRELSDQMSRVGMNAELTSLVRQEMDVESLLRTTLEYLLGKTGPTNAAVFMPTSMGDWTLGAYVNYDRPKDTCEAMLDTLAGVVPEQFAEESEAVFLRDDVEVESLLGAEAHWIEGCQALVIPCRQDDETIAVVMLFRDEREAFDAETRGTAQAIAGIFGEQLSRVIRVHHRHKPAGPFGLPGGCDDDDDLDLAA